MFFSLVSYFVCIDDDVTNTNFRFVWDRMVVQTTTKTNQMTPIRMMEERAKENTAIQMIVNKAMAIPPQCSHLQEEVSIRIMMIEKGTIINFITTIKGIHFHPNNSVVAVVEEDAIGVDEEMEADGVVDE